MKQQDVHKDRRENHQTQRHIPAHQQQQPPNHLQHRDKRHPSVRRHDARQDTRIPRWQRTLHKVQNPVHPEDKENKSQQNPRTNNRLVHIDCSPSTAASLAPSGLRVHQISRSVNPMPSTSAAAPALSLAGRTALITGGSRGIGAACVRLFRQAGARVAFSYQSAREQSEALVQELSSQELSSHSLTGGEDPPRPADCIALQQDLATPEHGHALVAAAVQAFGRLDILVVNHGVWPAHDQPIDTMPLQQWRSTLAINLDSTFGLVQAATGQMLHQLPALPADVATSPRGHIVLVASTAAQRGEAFHADYAASKGALISLTKSLSSELAPQGILANCVAPGWVSTEMSAAALNDPETSKKAMSLIPLGRVAHVNEIAAPILFLCTPHAGFISGEILNVNGGAVLVG